MTRALLFLIIFVCITPIAKAKSSVYGDGNFHIRLLQTPTAQIMELSGNFASNSEKHAMPALEELEKGKPLILSLNFGGGASNGIEPFARALQKWTNENQSRFITLVRDHKVCASYCLLFYMMADERLAYPQAQFGFHTASAGFAGVQLKFPGAMLGNYRQYGIDKAWLKQNRDLFKKLDVTWKKPEDLQGSKIVTRILSYSESVESLTQP